EQADRTLMPSMVIRSAGLIESTWQQNVTAAQAFFAPRQNDNCLIDGLIYADISLLFFTNAIPVITFGLLPIPQNVTLTQIRVLLARGNDWERTSRRMPTVVQGGLGAAIVPTWST